MMKRRSVGRSLLCTCLSLLACLMAQAGEARMDLSGLWRFQLDPMGFGKTAGSELYLSRLPETIELPGSTDEGGKGIRNVAAYVDRLSRKFEYCGQAWYQREVVIPETWRGKEILLLLERCHWETTVYVDGKPVATGERLSTPNRFLLTKQLTPGLHTLTLCVDNRLKYPMDQWAHGTTEYTQTNWNGIVGRMELVARPTASIQRIAIYPDIQAKAADVKLFVRNTGVQGKGNLTFHIREKDGKEICRTTHPYTIPAVADTVTQRLTLGKAMKLWDEFNPALYELEVLLETEAGRDSCHTRFGMRQVGQGKHHIRLNGQDIHLRGTLDCCVFPLTGYPPTDVAAWRRIFQTVKAYGLNHVRFHSWCPPEAAFDAADEVGLYLQAELPMWIKDVGKYPARRAFFEEEMYALLDEYGNHPSFILYCNGNENEGDFEVLEALIRKGQAHDNRRLYSASTARTHVAADQFYVSHVAAKVGEEKRQWITVYEGKPGTDWDRSKESDIDVPVIAHETGQRCMYPRFAEMKKYTGVLEPRNFEVYQERLARNGMLQQADAFFRATGAHTVLQYKEVNESLLRTATSGGFQLLGLSDFPGQGAAFVGILDAFWESKGLVTPEKYRESCAPIVLLARFSKRTYLNTETFTARLGLYHFGPENLRKGQLTWRLEDAAGQAVAEGKIGHRALPRATVDSLLGTVRIPLDRVTEAGKYTLKASLADSIRNEWDIWVYPSEHKLPVDGYSYVRHWEEAKKRLAQGEKVLLLPEHCAGRKTHFASHFWNPIMFNWEPMIVGTRIEWQHPLFRSFPTSYYADWQWWDILNGATAVDLTAMPTLVPLIQSIDTYEVNRKLGISFEARVGKGKLLVLCVGSPETGEGRPALRQLLLSARRYVASDDFAPATILQPYELDALFAPADTQQQETPASEAARQLLNQ